MGQKQYQLKSKLEQQLIQEKYFLQDLKQIVAYDSRQNINLQKFNKRLVSLSCHYQYIDDIRVFQTKKTTLQIDETQFLRKQFFRDLIPLLIEFILIYSQQKYDVQDVIMIFIQFLIQILAYYELDQKMEKCKIKQKMGFDELKLKILNLNDFLFQMLGISNNFKEMLNNQLWDIDFSLSIVSPFQTRSEQNISQLPEFQIKVYSYDNKTKSNIQINQIIQSSIISQK